MKTALITGGAKRIGKEIAIHLAKKGYDIALHFNCSENEALETQKIVNSITSCRIYKADFCKEEEILSLFNSVKKDSKNIDLLINNASIFERFRLQNTSIEFINKIISINLKAPLILIKEFANLNSYGNIINILDSKIFKNDYNYFMYTLTKKCVAELTRMASIEFSPKLRINGIALGLILQTENKDKKIFENFVHKIPLKKIGELVNLLQTIDFLIENPYITGEIITLDGGLSLI